MSFGILIDAVEFHEAATGAFSFYVRPETGEVLLFRRWRSMD